MTLEETLPSRGQKMFRQVEERSTPGHFPQQRNIAPKTHRALL